ncbi:MAG: class I SAM-dependent rRNA methyltransferase [Myxococcota bacterium]
MSLPETLRLKRPLERVISRGHPWVFRDALERPPRRPGRVHTLLDRKGAFLARGLSDAGPIAFRSWTTSDESVDARLLTRRFRSAVALRSAVRSPDTDAYRLLHGEGDRVPGVVCDRYGPVAVLRFDGEGAQAFEGALLELLREEGAKTLMVKSRGEEASVRVGPAPPDVLVVEEHGMRLPVALRRGQKTGLFLDHRASRMEVRKLSEGRRVLNLYSYTGAFSVAAGLGGARSVTSVDVAEAALELAVEGFRLNGLDVPHATHAGDVPEFLRSLPRGAAFDLIVADPPSFAPREAAKKAALKSYRLLHRACLERLAPEGLYLAASCSSHVRRGEFQESLVDGARSAGTALQVLGSWGAAADHPTLAVFPEGDYLKVVLCRRVR